MKTFWIAFKESYVGFWRSIKDNLHDAGDMMGFIAAWVTLILFIFSSLFWGIYLLASIM